MNTRYRSFAARARDPHADAHALHIARHGRDHYHEGSPTGDIVCCICWGHAADVDRCHTSHHVPGTDADLVGCCPAHHLRSRFFIESGGADGGETAARAVADGGRRA